MIRSALLATAVALATCNNKPTPVPVPVPTPDVVVDSGTECAAKVLDSCGLAGERLCRLGCLRPDGQPYWRSGDRSFAEVCREAHDDGRDWRPDCLVRITDCSQIEAAYRTREGAACTLWD